MHKIETSLFGEPLTVYYKEPRVRIFDYIRRANEIGVGHASVEAIIHCAYNADGTPMFNRLDDSEDRRRLLDEADPKEVYRLGEAIMKAGEPGN